MGCLWLPHALFLSDFLVGNCLALGYQGHHSCPSSCLSVRTTRPFFLAGKLGAHPIFHPRMKPGSLRGQLSTLCLWTGLACSCVLRACPSPGLLLGWSPSQQSFQAHPDPQVRWAVTVGHSLLEKETNHVNLSQLISTAHLTCALALAKCSEVTAYGHLYPYSPPEACMYSVSRENPVLVSGVRVPGGKTQSHSYPHSPSSIQSVTKYHPRCL